MTLLISLVGLVDSDIWMPFLYSRVRCCDQVCNVNGTNETNGTSCYFTDPLGPAYDIVNPTSDPTFIEKAYHLNVSRIPACEVPVRDADSGGPGGPSSPLGLAIAYDSYPLPIDFAWDLMEVTYIWPPWMTGSCHPRQRF